MDHTVREGKVFGIILVHNFDIAICGRKWKGVAKYMKCGGNENLPFIDVNFSVSAQMCYWQCLEND